jgi:hypothetical protein
MSSDQGIVLLVLLHCLLQVDAGNKNRKFDSASSQSKEEFTQYYSLIFLL